MVAGVDGADYTVRELLIEMRGDMQLIRRDNETTQRELREQREKHHALAQEVTILIAHKNKQEGEHAGFAKAVKAVYGLATICGLSGVVAVFKSFSH